MVTVTITAAAKKSIMILYEGFGRVNKILDW
jgi:hypothetical protein